MIKDFILPDIGEGIVECEIVEWLVEEGDIIEEDQVVVEIMTDKAVVQIPSMDSGRMSSFHYQTGEIAKVHTPLFAIEIEETAESDSDRKEAPALESPPEENKATSPVIQEDSVPPETAGGKKVLATPAVRRLGRELNIDLGQISGSGKNGRILKEDLQLS